MYYIIGPSRVVQEGEQFDLQSLIAPVGDVTVNPEQSTEAAGHNNSSNLVVSWYTLYIKMIGGKCEEIKN